MKALTIRQPWAWAIVHAGKRIENRTRRTNHRGRIYIHAGLAHPSWQPMVDCQTRTASVMVPPSDTLHYGCVIATAELVDCYYSERMVGAWGEPQAWHWLLDHVKPVKSPMYCRGQLGLWEY